MHDDSQPHLEEKPAAKPARLTSLDVFRGITIAGMILVNNGGGGGTYAPLKHATWDGWTPTDLVFPFFLLIVGVAIPFSLGNRKTRGTDTFGLIFRIARRALVIFGIGLILNGFPNYELAKFRIPGVLQRIALCYLCGAIIELFANTKVKIAITACLLLGYWALMSLVAAPGYEPGDLSRKGNLAAAVDRAILTPDHLYKKGNDPEGSYDPEGPLSTLPAIATTLIGMLAGGWLRSDRSGYEKNAGLFFAGWFGVVLGWVWSAGFPINKALWTSSFVLLTAGLGLQLLAVCYWLIDLKGIKRWATPFLIFGTNAIAAYVLSAFVNRGLTWPIGSGDTAWTIKSIIYGKGYTAILSPANSSLAWALTIVAICFGVVYVMYRKGIHIKA
jgi:predicted acyltransferase